MTVRRVALAAAIILVLAFGVGAWWVVSPRFIRDGTCQMYVHSAELQSQSEYVDLDCVPEQP